MKNLRYIYFCETSVYDGRKSLTRFSISDLNIEVWLEEESYDDTDGYAIGTASFVFGRECVSACLFSDGDVRLYDTDISNSVEKLFQRLYRAVQHNAVRTKHLLDIASAIVQDHYPRETTTSRDLRRGYCIDRNTRRVRKITRRERNLWGA